MCIYIAVMDVITVEVGNIWISLANLDPSDACSISTAYKHKKHSLLALSDYKPYSNYELHAPRDMYT